jgi:hypothetical protein
METVLVAVVRMCLINQRGPDGTHEGLGSYI